MVNPGSKIVMTKGYKGEKGIVVSKTDSQFDIYIVKLENGINIVVGLSAFNIERQ